MRVLCRSMRKAVRAPSCVRVHKSSAHFMARVNDPWRLPATPMPPRGDAMRARALTAVRGRGDRCALAAKQSVAHDTVSHCDTDRRLRGSSNVPWRMGSSSIQLQLAPRGTAPERGRYDRKVSKSTYVRAARSLALTQNRNSPALRGREVCGGPGRPSRSDATETQPSDARAAGGRWPDPRPGPYIPRSVC